MSVFVVKNSTLKYYQLEGRRKREINFEGKLRMKNWKKVISEKNQKNE